MSAAAEVPVSPYQLLDPLTSSERADLRRSIQTHGCLVPVIVDDDGCIIDGHHRVEICDELDQSYVVDQRFGLTHDEKVALALELNDVRRQRTYKSREERDARIVELRRQGLSTTVIAEEIGMPQTTVADVVSELAESGKLSQPSEITGKDGKTRPATQPDRSAEAVADRREQILVLADAGIPATEIAEAVGVSVTTVYNHLKDRGKAPATATGVPSRTPRAVAERYDKVRDLAGQGYTSAQIAAAVGMSEAGLRNGCRERGIEIPADAVVGRTHKHDSNRIVNEAVHTVAAAVMGLRLMRPADLDRDQIHDWTASLSDSIRALNRLNKQLKEMVQ